MQGAMMAEDNTPNRGNEQANEDDLPPLIVPSHDPLPPPPDISFVPPTLGQAAPLSQRNNPAKLGISSPQAPSSFNLGTGMSAGITLASSVVVGFLIGQWIDHHWHLSMPWGTIVFSLTGVAAGFINLFRILSVTDDHPKK